MPCVPVEIGARDGLLVDVAEVAHGQTALGQRGRSGRPAGCRAPTVTCVVPSGSGRDTLERVQRVEAEVDAVGDRAPA